MALTEQEVIRQLNKLMCFLEPLNHLLNSHLGSFFVEDMWNKYIPPEILSELSNLNSVENFIQAYPGIIRNKYSNNFADDYPNLLNFVREAINVSIIKKEKYSKLLQDLENLFDSEKFPNFDVEMEKFMTSKKLHEVQIISRMVALISSITQSSHIVDVGGGKGYLSCTLALNYSFKVLGLDSSEVTTCGAIKRSENLARLWNGKIFKCSKDAQNEKIYNKKAQEQFIERHYKQVITFVKPDTNVEDILKENFNEEITGITLTGLHTCGDLAPTCLKMFLSHEKIKGIINVGCCYNLISEEFLKDHREKNMERGTNNYGFPMSRFLRARNYSLGQNARMVACHALDRFNLNSEFEFSQTSLFYRAVLETVRQTVTPFTSRGKVGRFGKKSGSFHEYMFTAFKKLGVSSQLTVNDLDRLYESYSDKKPLLTAFYLLRISLAPVVESIILLDRILYLIENDVNNVYLVPLFNLKISPRGFGVIAWKNFKKS